MTFIAGTTTLTPLTPFSDTPIGLNLLGVGNDSGAIVTPLSVANSLFGTTAPFFGSTII
jgi:hypothetical protein